MQLSAPIILAIAALASAQTDNVEDAGAGVPACAMHEALRELPFPPLSHLHPQLLSPLGKRSSAVALPDKSWASSGSTSNSGN